MLKIDVGFEEYCNDFCKNREPLVSAEQFACYINDGKLFLESVIEDKYEGNFDDEIKACLFALAETIAQERKLNNIKSESIDGYTVTYNKPSRIRTKLFETAALYLEKTGLMFAGVK
jgi:hypothetical protein